MSKRSYVRTAVLALSLATAAAAAAGCHADEAAMAKPAPAMEAEAQAAAPLAAADSLGEVQQQAPVQRKLIQTAELHIEVGSYLEARREIDRLLSAAGGHVADAQIEHRDGDVSRAELTLRVPVGELSSFLAATAGTGKVLHETLQTEDITEGYTDLKARLENARRLEGRLLALMSNQADTVEALLEVERELGRVREQIERFEGKLRLWDGQVALSTVKLQLLTKQVYTAATPPTLTERLRDTFGDSWAALVGFGRGLLVVAVALVPWLLPLALLAWALRKLVLRVARRYQQALEVRAPAPAYATSPLAAPVQPHPVQPGPFAEDDEAPQTLPSGGGSSGGASTSAATFTLNSWDYLYPTTTGKGGDAPYQDCWMGTMVHSLCDLTGVCNGRNRSNLRFSVYPTGNTDCWALDELDGQ